MSAIRVYKESHNMKITSKDIEFNGLRVRIAIFCFHELIS